MYRNYIKPLFDFPFGILLLIFLSPIFIVIIVLLYFLNEKEIFFKQERTGLKDKSFTIFKFCSMNNKKDKNGNLLPDNERITPLGNFLRNSSLDEIPQILNIIKGDMSFVGPRPLIPDYLPLYNKEQSKRHDVKPGLTGWTQINGRNSLTWAEKFDLDYWYVQNQSFLLDLKILFKTAKKIFTSSDVNQNSNLTMERFNGKN